MAKRIFPPIMRSLLATALIPYSAVAQTTFSEHGAAVLNGVDYSSRSASLADIDRDGDLDLMFQGASGARQLLRNEFNDSGVLRYTNISSSLTGLGDSWSAAWGDYDGDGYVDVFVGQTNSGTTGDVLKNNAGANFTNTSNAVGLNDPGFHQNVAWNDIDNDRDLDLIIGMEGPERHEIYLQGSDGHFTPVGATAGFQVAYGTKSYGMAVGDTDGDGDLDIYISTCISGGNIRNNFFENQLAQTGQLSFIDIAGTNGTQNFDNSYSSEFLDFDDDRDLDLFMVGADGKPSRIFRNDGGNQFTDVATLLGHPLLSDAAGDLNGGRAVDYDNDGDLDLFMHDNLQVTGSNQARKLYRNDGNWKFTDVTSQVGIASTNQGAYDSVWGDLDLDGDLDLIAPTRNGIPERVFLSNASENGNHWLYLRLAGTNDNSTSIGASVYATINEDTPAERTLRREANTNAGAFNQSDLPVHFGLGLASIIDELRIVWPDGVVKVLTDVAVDQYLTVHYPGDFDENGVIDAADLTQWRGDFELNDDSDADGDGDTDGADFLAWQRVLGAGVRNLAGAHAVPEPNNTPMMLVGSILASAWIARRPS